MPVDLASLDTLISNVLDDDLPFSAKSEAVESLTYLSLQPETKQRIASNGELLDKILLYAADLPESSGGERIRDSKTDVSAIKPPSSSYTLDLQKTPERLSTAGHDLSHVAGARYGAACILGSICSGPRILTEEQRQVQRLHALASGEGKKDPEAARAKLEKNEQLEAGYGGQTLPRSTVTVKYWQRVETHGAVSIG